MAAALAITISTRWRDPAYGLVLVWASLGIAAGQPSTPSVARAAWLVVGVVVAALGAATLWRARRGGGLAALLR